MKLLEEIPQFPEAVRRTLRGRFGIDSAESFYAHAVQNPEGIGEAAQLPAAEVERLSRLVEGYLPYDFVQRCHAPAPRHRRGLLIDR